MTGQLQILRKTGDSQHLPGNSGNQGSVTGLLSSSASVPDVYAVWKKEETPETTGNLLRALEPIMDKALTTYANGDPSLKVQAKIQALEAARSFKPERGASLKTHVYTQLQRLRRISADRTETIHIPEARRLQQLAITRYVDSYRSKYGAEPSLQNISDTLSLPLKRVSQLMQTPGEVSQFAVTGEKGDILVSQERSTEDMIRDWVYQDLDEVNRKVMEWSTGYLGSPVLTQVEIARNLRISPAAVNGRRNTIRNRLQKAMSKLA